MTPQEEQERYRYLQLKAKMGSQQQTQTPPSLGSQISGWSKMPEKMAGATMDVMKDQIQNPIGKGAMNVLSKTMPPTFSRFNLGAIGALEGAQALAAIPKVGELGSGLAGQLESLVGSPKGTLAHGYQSAKNFFGPGKKAAQPLYQAAEDAMPKGASVFEGMYKPEQIVDKAKEILSNGGKLEPTEGLMYRKAIDSLSKTGRYVKDELFNMRSEADEIAKGSRLVRKGDQLYTSGIKNQALRRPFPLTQTGKTATVKTGMMFVPGLGQILAPLFSPAIQGATATGLGLGVKGLNYLASNPHLIALLNSLISQESQRTSQSQGMSQ